MSISGSKLRRYSPQLSCTENPAGIPCNSERTDGGTPRVQEEHTKAPKSYQGHKD